MYIAVKISSGEWKSNFNYNNGQPLSSFELIYKLEHLQWNRGQDINEERSFLIAKNLLYKSPFPDFPQKDIWPSLKVTAFQKEK